MALLPSEDFAAKMIPSAHISRRQKLDRQRTAPRALVGPWSKCASESWPLLQPLGGGPGHRERGACMLAINS